MREICPIKEIHSAQSIERERVKRLFQFLREFHQIRHPIKRQIEEQPWRLWLRELPEHPVVLLNDALAINIGRSELQGRSNEREEEPGQNEEEPILRVRRPDITPSPRPPESLRGWLERGWEDPAQEARVRDTLSQADQQGETIVLRFADDPQRVRAFETWKRTRDEWARRERPVRSAMQVFEELYGLYGRIQRESERLELVLGDGILSWVLPSGGIYHPLLLQRVQLQFDIWIRSAGASWIGCAH